MWAIDTYCPAWRTARIHESSPATGGASRRLASECPNYVSSQWIPAQGVGTTVGGVRCENLESLTFKDGEFDLHVTQDVLEHVFHPEKAFAEIARTLAPGGLHIFTTPLVNKHSRTVQRASESDGNVSYLLPEVYHGNPVGNGQSLVTFDWGYDICARIFEASGLFTQMLYIDDVSRGIRAEYIEVLVSMKPSA